MTAEIQDMLKKFMLTAGVFIFLALVISVSAFFIKPKYNEQLKTHVEELLQVSQKEPIKLSQVLQFKKTSFSSFKAWSIEGKKHADEIIFAVALTGDSGPYTGVFLVSQHKETQFCGLLGLPESIENPKKFGITNRILKYRIKMLENITERGGLIQ